MDIMKRNISIKELAMTFSVSTSVVDSVLFSFWIPKFPVYKGRMGIDARDFELFRLCFEFYNFTKQTKSEIRSMGMQKSRQFAIKQFYTIGEVVSITKLNRTQVINAMEIFRIRVQQGGLRDGMPMATLHRQDVVEVLRAVKLKFKSNISWDFLSKIPVDLLDRLMMIMDLNYK